MDFFAVLDGELLVIRDGQVAPFADLQQRLNRKAPAAKMLRDYPGGRAALRHPVRRRARMCARCRSTPAGRGWRRGSRATIRPAWIVSEIIAFDTIEQLAALRDGARGASLEGLMLKRRDSPYVPGRPRGLWWKWKRDPLTIDAVLMYAQRGHGKRSSYYSDYTFGLWRDADGGGAELVPVGKAYFGFTDAELAFLDRWVRNHTTNRFGPVREVEQGLVLEVAFDAAQLSTRHKSGVALRFPRIARIRTDKPAAEADRLETLLRLVEGGVDATPSRGA